MKPTYKYIHYVSCNFELHSDLLGETEEELNQLYAGALENLKAIVEHGEPFIEFVSTEPTEDD